MDFRITDQAEELRRQVLGFVHQELPPDWWYSLYEEESSDELWAFSRQLARKLARRGWLALAWPKEYGGMGASHLERVVFEDVTTYWGIPYSTLDGGVGGLSWVGPSLMRVGSDAQKQQHLPPLAAGEAVWCTGYSEPGAGSDLASLQTRAVEGGDCFEVNGQKVWTSCAHRAGWCWLAARTDPEVPKHKGISAFLVDMKSPGITISPLINMAGIHSFNQVFFDNVRVPKENLVGEKNRGWYYVAIALDFERTGLIFLNPARHNLDKVVELVRETVPGPQAPLRHKLAERWIEGEVGRWLCYRQAWLLSQEALPNQEASMAKLYCTEAAQRIAQTAMEALGLYGELGKDSPWVRLRGKIERAYLIASSHGIDGGTSEIQRLIIATRGLGLPRGE